MARIASLGACAALALLGSGATAIGVEAAGQLLVIHAARLVDVATGRIVAPAEILVEDERIKAVGTAVEHPRDARILDLGDVTLLPGLIDAHVHLFLHPGSESLQTVEESVPKRTILATLAARDDLLAGFTAERDMGTEGAGSADSAVRDAINKGLIVGPRLRISGNAIDILGGHEDANRFNPEQHVLSNATYANSADELIAAIREQRKQGSDFVKIYETGKDSLQGGQVAVHAMGEPGTLYAAQAGVASIDHATQLSEETMRLMKAKGIPAVPTFAIFEYFMRASAAGAQREGPLLEYKIGEFKRQVAAGVPFAVGSDVGPFPHGTQARELELMVKYGMTPLAVLQADMINGAKLLGWAGQIGELKAGYFADIIAVPGSPLDDITVVERVSFVMKDGRVERPRMAR
jgi:imidazolonepropionase-like amidohydrolase